MTRAEKISGIAPVPHYVMPDHSMPPYEVILEDLQEFPHCIVGNSYFYVVDGGESCTLCRIVYSGGKIYFHEIVDHRMHAISDEDLRESASGNSGSLALPDHYPVSLLIEQKLRILYDQ